MKKSSFFLFLFLSFFSYGSNEKTSIIDVDDDIIWNSKPEEADSANVQVLDKISGKVFKTKIKVGQSIRFESLDITLKRCFKSSMDDANEVYAYLIIQDGERVRFSGWLFASAPAVNLFEHSVYDVRVEF